MDINWQLCCLCQLDTQEFLQTPKKEGFISLERDFKEYQSIKGTLLSGVKVILNNLNDGSDIASTLEANQAKYHKKCRSYCKSTNFGVLLYLANLANSVSSLIFVAANIYVDRTLHRWAAGRRQI